MKSYSRAFTLIELLVVIAIIAILAAILFPVFAQAKAAAKASASISNVQQQGVAMIMYETDFDDGYPPSTAWNTGNDPLTFGPGLDFSTWVWLVQPYEKNFQIANDPLGPAFPQVVGFPQSLVATINPTYGFNYTSLAPWYGSPVHTHTITQTREANPAGMPMLVSKWANTETNFDADGITVLGFQFNPNEDNGPILNTTVDAPDCYTIPGFCAGNWGKHFTSAYSWGPSLNENIVAGAHTGGCSRRNAGLQMTVVFCDSHANKRSAGYMSQGTNWTEDLNEDNLVVTDTSKYLWYLTPNDKE